MTLNLVMQESDYVDGPGRWCLVGRAPCHTDAGRRGAHRRLSSMTRWATRASAECFDFGKNLLEKEEGVSVLDAWQGRK